jgi:hypothetical protein
VSAMLSVGRVFTRALQGKVSDQDDWVTLRKHVNDQSILASVNSSGTSEIYCDNESSPLTRFCMQPLSRSISLNTCTERMDSAICAYLKTRRTQAETTVCFVVDWNFMEIFSKRCKRYHDIQHYHIPNSLLVK